VRALTALAAALAAVAGFVFMHLIHAAGSHGRPARPPVSSAAAAKTGPSPSAASRLRVGVISYNLPLFDMHTKIHPTLTATYINWGVPFPAAKVAANHVVGATTLIVLEPRTVSPRQIIAGKANAYLSQFAGAERKLNVPVILSFAPEANGIWYTWGKGHTSPALYRKMYRYVHFVMLRDGARHITWLWQVDRTSRATEPLKVLWPGRNYVNAIGFDGQLTGASSSFYTVFGPTLAEVRRFTTVPVMLSEVGVQPGRSRPGKVAGLVTAAHKVHLTALNFFDVGTWNFDNDPATLAAVRKAAQQNA